MGRILLAVLASTALLVPAAQADWASFHGDALNTGSLSDSSYQVYKDWWWSEKGGTSDKQVLASPVVKDGRLIVADRGGNVRALDVQSGFEFWRYKMPKSVEGTPAVSADHVYVADIAGNLKSINLFDGRVEFERTIGATAGNIAEHEGKIFVGTEAGELKAFLADLTPLWTFKASDWFEGVTCLPQPAPAPCKSTCVDLKSNLNEPMANQPIRGKPAIYSGYVIFGSLNHFVYAVSEGGRGNLKTDLRWQFRTDDVVVAAPTIAAGKAVVGSYDGHVYSFEAKPSAAGPTVCPNEPSDFYAPRGVQNPANPFPVPETNGQVTKIDSSPANAGGVIFIGANNGAIYALNAATMTEKWHKQIGSEITYPRSSPAVANGIVIIGSDNKNVYWLDANNGNELNKFTAQTAVQVSPAIDGNLAFLAGLDGTWYAFGQERPQRPDLTVTAIDTTNSKFTATVRNQGTVASGATKVRGFGNGGQIFEESLGPLQPNAEVTITQNVTFAKGNINVRLFADPLNQVVESDESNNALNRTVTLGAPPAPKKTNAPQPTTTSGKGKIPAWDLAVPIALVGVALLVRRRQA